MTLAEQKHSDISPFQWPVIDIYFVFPALLRLGQKQLDLITGLGLHPMSTNVRIMHSSGTSSTTVRAVYWSFPLVVRKTRTWRQISDSDWSFSRAFRYGAIVGLPPYTSSDRITEHKHALVGTASDPATGVQQPLYMDMSWETRSWVQPFLIFGHEFNMNLEIDRKQKKPRVVEVSFITEYAFGMFHITRTEVVLSHGTQRDHFSLRSRASALNVTLVFSTVRR